MAQQYSASNLPGQQGQQPVQSRPLLARYASYAEAQRAVDFLSDEKFAVENVGILGSDLRMVETVTGRMTWGRAAGSGVLSGLWFGAFVGLLLGLFTSSTTSNVTLVVLCALYGALFGVIFGLIGYALTGGRRDFTSRSQIVASTYDVVCSWPRLDEAKNILARLEAP
jgi:hypothetical protein